MLEPPKPSPDGRTCQADHGCRGQPLHGVDQCLAHADKGDRTAALERISHGSPVDIARGVEFT